jgi:hypothetical protein
MKEPPRRYASAAAFRVALEIRLKAISRAEGIDLQRLRRQVSFGDAVVQPTELIEGRNWLDFAGIPAAMLMAISKEQQFAEKLHTYTLPRHDSSNSRVKDLVDMVLLARLLTMDKSLLHLAISATFSIRGTHPIPANLPAPPAFWTAPFLVLARECQIELTLSDALQILTEYVSL